MPENSIIIVDDDVEDHFILTEYFRDAGIDDKVMFFNSAQNALQYLGDIGNNAELPKLLVLDLNMPILNGSQALQQIKQTPRLKNIPVIIFSTSENETERRKCLSIGALDYMVKPVSWNEGHSIVKRFASFIG